jgi:hypothetical protein
VQRPSEPTAPHVRSVPSGVLHTIMFNRSLGQVKPQEVDSELFDTTYVRASTAARVPRQPCSTFLTTLGSQLQRCSTMHMLGRGPRSMHSLVSNGSALAHLRCASSAEADCGNPGPSALFMAINSPLAGALW